MSGDSRFVTSSQQTLHPGLLRIVRRHLDSSWRHSPSGHTVTAFQHFLDWYTSQAAGRPLWLDSGCGTGRAAVTLARSRSDCIIVGIDQSAARLRRGETRFSPMPENVLLLRAECADFWRLLQGAGIVVERHFLLYPNPWPKPGHFQRRWHGHPVFPQLLAISEVLELRTNWAIYAQEMAAALALAGRPAEIEPIQPDTPLTDFEEKYQASSHPLWRLVSCRV